MAVSGSVLRRTQAPINVNEMKILDHTAWNTAGTDAASQLAGQSADGSGTFSG